MASCQCPVYKDPSRSPDRYMLTIRSSTARVITIVSKIRSSSCLSRLSTGSLLLAVLRLVRLGAMTDSPRPEFWGSAWPRRADSELPPSGTYGLGVIAEDEIGDTGRLFLPFDLILQVIHNLDPAGDLGGFGQGNVHPDAGACGQRGGKPDPVKPVIEDHADVVGGENLPEQASGQAQGEESV